MILRYVDEGRERVDGAEIEALRGDGGRRGRRGAAGVVVVEEAADGATATPAGVDVEYNNDEASEEEDDDG